MTDIAIVSNTVSLMLLFLSALIAILTSVVFVRYVRKLHERLLQAHLDLLHRYGALMAQCEQLQDAVRRQHAYDYRPTPGQQRQH
jgi:hypothetical protein